MCQPQKQSSAEGWKVESVRHSRAQKERAALESHGRICPEGKQIGIHCQPRGCSSHSGHRGPSDKLEMGRLTRMVFE